MTTIRIHTVHTPDGAALSTQTIGDWGNPALLLIGGATWSMDWWDDDFCRGIAARSRMVVRYDARDTGQSTSWPPGAPGYSGGDLVSDVVAILDHLGLSQAHIVGLSMGGAIAQRVAHEHRHRTATVTLMSTSPIDPDITGLPSPNEDIMATFNSSDPAPDWADRHQVINYIVEGERPFAGPGSFDVAGLRRIAARVFERTDNLASSMTNHFLLEEDELSSLSLRDLAGIPTLVVHGTADPMFPLAHGRALADGIPHARLLELTDVGHQLPPRHTWPTVIQALVEHTAEETGITSSEETPPD